VVVPAERQADKVVAITIEGPIDATTALSVRRRIALAEKGGANAIVIEINSPGGELGAVLEITNAIKASAISNTVAWVNPDAYSGGAIVALACREIVLKVRPPPWATPSSSPRLLFKARTGWDSAA
jgi:membrane-bound serine protease (ClpP class)